MAQEFKTESVFEALRGPLALVEDAEKRQAFERYVEAARFPLERAVFDLLSGLVSAMNERVSDHYRLRLAYHTGALELDVEPLPGAERAEPDVVDLPEFLADGEMEKITIRIPAELKDLITQAAGGAGISANSWFIRVLARALGGAGLEVEHQRRARHRHRAERSAPHFYDHDAGAHGPHREPHGPGKRLQGWFGGEQRGRTATAHETGQTERRDAMATNPMLLCYLAELDRARDLEAYERRKRYGLFETLPPARPLRSTLAAWLLRLALRLDARTGESSSSPPEPAHA